MKYKESATIELKRVLEDDMKTEIVAFLNSYLGGCIYVGVDDDGQIFKTTEEEKDLMESKVINWIRDEAIFPNCSEYVGISFNEDGVLEVHIEPGRKKPYYIKSKGLKPSGVYIRYGRNKSQASHEEIKRLIRESDEINYEDELSKNQNLTFESLNNKLKQQGIHKDFNMVTSGLIDLKTNMYTNLAYWLSDQYSIETKMAVYQGLDRSVFRSKKEFGGSLIKQIDSVLEYFDLCNEVRVIIDGSPTRKEIPSYKMKAAREGILNCFCHKDFSRKSNIKIEFFDNRCEMISPGGFYDGLTLEDALSGMQSFRNENLVKLLFKLGYIENYASGLSRIYSEYANEESKPSIESSMVMLKLILPNINYLVFKKVNDTLDDTLDDTLESNEERLLLILSKNPKINQKELSEVLAISVATVKRNIKSLSEKGYIVRVGGKRFGQWVVKK